jgi:putative hydrolase
MQELSEQLQGKLFEPSRTPEQVEVLGRLETLLALTEGWVDELVAKAASRYMPNHAALAESWRRRRGAGGPAEEVFASLVGLELRPRRMRDAANLWAAITELRGQKERDRLWSHPDLLPTAAALDDPMGFATPEGEAPTEGDEMDRALAQLLAEESDKPEG